MRRLLRRLAWLLTRLVLVIGILFFVLAEATRANDVDCSAFGTERLEESCLPLFLNARPRDLARRVNDVVVAIAQTADGLPGAELERLGGASLPILVPRLGQLPEAVRDRVALAILPVLRRMNWRGVERVQSGAGAYAFLTESWRERAIDFRPTTVARWVERLSMRGGTALAASVAEYDTYALPSLMDALPDIHSSSDIERARRLVDVARKVSTLPWGIPPLAGAVEAQTVVDHWRRWWQLHALEYQAVSGPARWSAMLEQTRFGQWTALVFEFKFGTDRQHEPILQLITAAGFRTLALVLAGVFGAVGVSIAKMRTTVARARHSLVVRAIASVPSVAAVAGLASIGLPRSLLTACAISCASVVALELGNSVRTTTSNTPRPGHIGVMRDSGNATRQVVPDWLFAGHRWPWLLTLAFCVEKGFGVTGIGMICIQAFRQLDLHLLMAITTMTATWVMLVEFAVQLGRQMRRRRPHPGAAT